MTASAITYWLTCSKVKSWQLWDKGHTDRLGSINNFSYQGLWQLHLKYQTCQLQQRFTVLGETQHIFLHVSSTSELLTGFKPQFQSNLASSWQSRELEAKASNATVQMLQYHQLVAHPTTLCKFSTVTILCWVKRKLLECVVSDEHKKFFSQQSRVMVRSKKHMPLTSGSLKYD